MEMLPHRSFFDFTPVNACLTGAQTSDSPPTPANTAWPENPAPESDIPPANAVFTGAGLVSPMRIIPALAGREPVWYNRFRSKKTKTHDHFGGQSNERRSRVPRVSAD
jgi:hypothetical protein